MQNEMSEKQIFFFIVIRLINHKIWYGQAKILFLYTYIVISNRNEY